MVVARVRVFRCRPWVARQRPQPGCHAASCICRSAQPILARAYTCDIGNCAPNPNRIARISKPKGGRDAPVTHDCTARLAQVTCSASKECCQRKARYPRPGRTRPPSPRPLKMSVSPSQKEAADENEVAPSPQDHEIQQLEGEMQGTSVAQHEASLYETEVKEQDRWLPIANGLSSLFFCPFLCLLCKHAPAPSQVAPLSGKNKHCFCDLALV